MTHNHSAVQETFDALLNNKQRALILIGTPDDYKEGDEIYTTGPRGFVRRIITHVFSVQDEQVMVSLRPLTKEEKNDPRN